MLKTEAHVDKLNEFYYLPKQGAKCFIMKKMDREDIIKNEIVINMFSLFYSELWFIFELKVPGLRQTVLNAQTKKNQ